MWCLITRCHLQFPPVARPYQACFSKAAVPSGQQAQEWSYGTWLLDAKYDSVDPELRELVVRCMNHRPLARPSFDELAEVFERRLPRQTGAEDAAPGQAAPAASGLDSPLSEQEFCRKFFGEPLAAGTTDWHKAPPPGSEAPPRDEVGGFEETLRPLRVPPPESVQPEMQEGRGPNVKPAYLAPMGETERLELNRIAATAGRGRARRALSRLFGL
ncbi:hypothetical protein VTK73DRAFT_7294 [Phialemonium thermophilum]|uniref:Uncharacterized protein n=1 Tax=Phialemonium thermophilum TaxID=223376 RepID=A0ABR3WF63_9PEZI